MTIAIIIAAIGWALIPEILWARRLRKANARIAELEALQQSRDERGRFKALKTKKVGREPFVGEEISMGENTKIEWADHTFNPWIGCTKVSPACDNCYAENLMDTRYGRVRWGAGEDRSRTAASTWRNPRRWNKDAIAAGTRPFVFCASLADVFDNEVDERWRHDLFKLIEETPALVWLLLTKRIGNVRKMTDPMRGCRIIPSNVAIGATMANQEEYDRDRIKLDEVKVFADVRFTFGSFEPLLGPVILDSYAPDWIIVGGESGANARDMRTEWALAMQDQSARLGRVFNFKQNGGRSADKGGHQLLGREYFARPTVDRLAA